MAKQVKMWTLTAEDVAVVLARVFGNTSEARMPQEQSVARSNLRKSLELLRKAGIADKDVRGHAEKLIGKEI